MHLALYSGNVKINIPPARYNAELEIWEYSDLEQIFINNGLLRIDGSDTFEDANAAAYFGYEVDFSKLSYVIMQ